MRTVSIVGLGRAGGAIAVALDKAGFQIELVVSRDRSVSRKKLAQLSLTSDPTVSTLDERTPITSSVVLVAVPDPFIAQTAELLSERIKQASCVLHISGSLPSDILLGKFAGSVPVGSFHPLVSLSDASTGRSSFQGAFFCVEGDAESVKIGNELAIALGGRPFTIEPRMKPLYHAAAVMAAGHVVALFDLACEVLSKTGLAGPSPPEVLWPLVASAVDNLRVQTASRSLTGSFARGDLETIERHIDALQGEGPFLALQAYRLLGAHSVDLARAEGVDENICRAIMDVLNLDKEIGE
ncbi:MAG TPA: DUF2520 domain-containing protein [Pyrinomonadaceae bacterium]|nr:DUF2520 domain-containing protein [Pyrinomonadaceae bacterium]HMP65731.1 DUF2520 domain-containing protein [Pyrinomonadaceae bacterium]